MADLCLQAVQQPHRLEVHVRGAQPQAGEVLGSHTQSHPLHVQRDEGPGHSCNNNSHTRTPNLRIQLNHLHLKPNRKLLTF